MLISMFMKITMNKVLGDLKIELSFTMNMESLNV